MFSIHARNSSLQIDPLTLTVFDHFASFFFANCFQSWVAWAEKERELTVFEAFAHYSFCCYFFCIASPCTVEVTQYRGAGKKIFLGKPMIGAYFLQYCGMLTGKSLRM